MYKIIGSDGQEYGPVSRELLNQWIAQGRANAHTRVQVEGSGEWCELGTLPEFAPGFRPQPPTQLPPRVQSGFGGEAEANAIAEEVLRNDYRFDISDCFSRAWDLIAANFWLSVGVSALGLVLVVAASSIPFASLVLAYVLFGGLDWFFLKMFRGQKAELDDLFAGFSMAFVPLMLFSIVVQLLSGIGFLLCILPGIFLTVIWVPYTTLLIMDKKLDFWPAMEAGRKVIQRHWWQMFGFLLLCFVINLLGLALCGVGLFFTFPLTTAAVVAAYEAVFRNSASNTST